MMNILIVDDSSNIRYFITKALRSLDMELGEVTEAGDGLQALEILKTKKINVVLTDINMPQMDGIELTRTIRQNPLNENIKVIIISTEGSKKQVVESVMAGASGYLKKPFEPEEAFEILTEVLAK